MIFNEVALNELSQASSLGIILATLVFVAGAFTFKLPRIGGLIFTIAAFLALSISNHSPDMAFWGSASLILGTLANFFGWKNTIL